MHLVVFRAAVLRLIAARSVNCGTVTANLTGLASVRIITLSPLSLVVSR